MSGVTSDVSKEEKKPLTRLNIKPTIEEDPSSLDSVIRWEKKTSFNEWRKIVNVFVLIALLLKKKAY